MAMLTIAAVCCRILLYWLLSIYCVCVSGAKIGAWLSLDLYLHAATRGLRFSHSIFYIDIIAVVKVQEPMDMVLNSHSILRSRQEGRSGCSNLNQPAACRLPGGCLLLPRLRATASAGQARFAISISSFD